MGIELFEGSKKPSVPSQDNAFDASEVNVDVSQSEVIVSDTTSLR